MEETIDFGAGIRADRGQVADLASYLDRPSFHLLLSLIRTRQTMLVEELKSAEEDDDILRFAKQWKNAVQQEVELLYWPRLCAKLIEEDMEHAEVIGGADSGVAGTEGEGGHRGDHGEPDEGYEVAG